MKAPTLNEARTLVEFAHASSQVEGPVLRFYEDSHAILKQEIDNLRRQGFKRILVSCPRPYLEMLDLKQGGGEGYKWFDAQRDSPAEFSNDKNDAVIIAGAQDADLVSSQLLACLERKRGPVLAPITAHHCTKRPLFIMTIPKSGTHLLIRLLDKMKIFRNHGELPVAGAWTTLDDYNYHAPCSEFMRQDWTKAIGMHPFFRSPALFMYRNPLDILISELFWYQKEDVAFVHYFKKIDSIEDKLMCLIDDPFVLGTIRDRMNQYIGWLNFKNVIPVSYEELVGVQGGGKKEEQLKTIWSLQLKLNVPGSPQSYAESVYDPQGPTFQKGKIGRHKDFMNKNHYQKFYSMPQDFMDKLGYEKHDTYSRLIAKHRQAPLDVCKRSEQEVWKQRLVKESYLGFNIVYAAGQYVAIEQKLNFVDLSIEENRNKEGVCLGFTSLGDAQRYLDRLSLERKITEFSEIS
jgi:hypothetical protein